MILLQYLMSANELNSATNYLPIALQLLFAGGFVAIMFLLSNFLGPKRKTSDKLENFASGIETHGDARSPMAVKYFLVAILFVLFNFFFYFIIKFKIYIFIAFCLMNFYMTICTKQLTFFGFFNNYLPFF